MLTDSFGLPRYWATVWSALSTEHLEPSTQTKKLRFVEALYDFADGLHTNGYLDDVLGRCDIAALGDVLEAYFISLRNRPGVNESTQNQWQTGLGFVKDVLMRLTKGNPNLGMFAEMEAKLHYLDALYGQLRIQKTRRPDILRSLPPPVVSHLYELLDPESASNPFTRDECTRWTVFLAFIVLLHQGIRRGELLLLPVDVVKSAFDNKRQRIRYWMNITESKEFSDLDRRYNKPGIKTADSNRQIPVSEFTASRIQTYRAMN